MAISAESQPVKLANIKFNFLSGSVEKLFQRTIVNIKNEKRISIQYIA
jgi:hypothetical protein